MDEAKLLQLWKVDSHKPLFGGQRSVYLFAGTWGIEKLIVLEVGEDVSNEKALERGDGDIKDELWAGEAA